MIQGLFLAVLGIWVLAASIYRMLVLHTPEADIMGVIGVIALAINVAAAGAASQGDANVRAVWLFSRNDALGNIAVVIAAGLVAWTGTP